MEEGDTKASLHHANLHTELQRMIWKLTPKDLKGQDFNQSEMHNKLMELYFSNQELIKRRDIKFYDRMESLRKRIIKSEESVKSLRGEIKKLKKNSKLK